MWLQCAVPGEVSWHALAGPHAMRVAARIAEAARKLHQANIPANRAHTIDDELAILAELLARVGDQLPELRQRIRRIVDQCFKLARKVIPISPVGIHRDFYPDQVLIDGDRVFVVDHDLYTRGDPRLDIGNFCGHLIERGIRIEQHRRSYECAAAALIDRFLQFHGNDQAWREAIEVFTVLTVARHIFLSTRFPDRKATTVPLIEHMEHLLTGDMCAGTLAS